MSPQQLLFDSQEGRDLRGEGLDQVAANAPDFLALMRAVAESFAVINGTVSIDELRRYADARGIVPKHPNAWGAVFRGPRWVCCDTRRRSTIPSNHAREIKVWKLVAKGSS